MVNCLSEVKTPLRLNGRTMRSASTPSTELRSTMPSGWATIQPKRTPLVTRSARTSAPEAQARLTASERMACRSAVISRASSSTSPAPVRAIVCRSLENEGSVLSNCALSKPSETKTLATSSPDPPSIGSLWQPKQEFESGPLVRLKGGLTPLLRLVGMIACVAFGRPAPSAVVNFALKSSRPRSMRAGSAAGPAAATESKSTCDEKTRSSQLPPDAAPAARTAIATSAADAPKARFMSLAPRRRSGGSFSPLCHVRAGCRKRYSLVADRLRSNSELRTSVLIAMEKRNEHGHGGQPPHFEGHGSGGRRQRGDTRPRVAWPRRGARGYGAAGARGDRPVWISSLRSGRGAGAPPAQHFRLRDAERLQPVHAGDPRQCRRNVQLARRPPGGRGDDHRRRLQPGGARKHPGIPHRTL